MLTWLLLALVVYYIQIFLPATFKLIKLGLGGYLGSRDQEPVLSGIAGRLDRATRNMLENFAPFAALAVAALALGQGDNGQAILGAQIFVVSRALYIPLYAAAVPMIRSVAATGGWIGMFMIASALLTAA
jgi:uncharacterized MAPEG superfamily protein